MIKYTKITVLAGIALIASSCLLKADTITNLTSNTVTLRSAPVAVETIKVSSTSLFNAKEFGVSIGSGYVVDQKTPFRNGYDLNFNAGLFYFPYRNLGFEVVVPFYQTKGVSVSEVQVGSILRLPLSKTTPILKNISPYIGVGGVYNWKSKQDFAYIGTVGTEFRINSKIGIFAEGQYRNNEFSNWKNGSTSINGGLRLVF